MDVRCTIGVYRNGVFASPAYDDVDLAELLRTRYRYVSPFLLMAPFRGQIGNVPLEWLSDPPHRRVYW